MDIIYVDELFGLNALIDYILLLSAARLRALPLRRWRFAAGAALGGLYAVAAVLPGAAALADVPGKLLASALIALIAFGRGRAFWRSWACFLGLSAAFGGVMWAWCLMAGQRTGRLFVPVSGRVLLLGFGACYAAVRLCFGRLLQKRERQILPVRVRLGGRQSAFSALRDTGNSLYDPVTGLHVLVAEVRVLSPLLGGNGALLRGGDAPELMRTLSALPELNGRLRLVPYRAVGTAGGLLLCFRPDDLTLDGKREELLVALSPTPLSGDGEYSAVV